MAPNGVVVVYFSKLGGRLRTHQKIMLEADARAIATLKRYDFRGCHDRACDYRVPVFFVPDDTLRSAAFELARQLADGPSIALGYMKDNLDHALRSDLPDSLDQEAENLVRAAGTQDHKEAVRAFVEKRKPSFGGH